jgi:hypothetical protein
MLLCSSGAEAGPTGLVQGAGKLISLLVEDKRDHHVHPVLGDFALIDLNVLFLDPRPANVAERFRGSSQADMDGVLEAFR